MIFALGVLLISCLIYYLFEKGNLLKIWFTPVSQKVNQFISGFLILAVLSAITQLFLGFINGTSWSVAPDFTLEAFFASVMYDVRSVLFEELLFRGIALYFLLRWTGKRQFSLLLAASAFGVYHWFTFGVFGNILAMIVVFVTTGLMGYAFALAYEKTNSIILPIALHLGWNLINNTLFSNGPNGIQVLDPVQVQAPFNLGGYYDLISLAWYLLIPCLVILFINRFFTPQTKDFKIT